MARNVAVQTRTREIVHRTRGDPPRRHHAAHEPRRPLPDAQAVRLPRPVRHGQGLVPRGRLASTFRYRDGDTPLRGKRPLRRHDRRGRCLAGGRRSNSSRQRTEPGTAGGPATRTEPVVFNSGWRCRPTRNSDLLRTSNRHLTRWRAMVRRVFFSGPWRGGQSAQDAGLDQLLGRAHVRRQVLALPTAERPGDALGR